MTARFEAAWAAWNGAGAVATASWTGGAIAALEFVDVRGEAVLCPSNTFMATPLAILAAAGRPVFVDCNRDDLCASLRDIEAKLHQHRPKAVFLVHIGGHIAFEVQEIADLCAAEGVFLIEDCAHAHGAQWEGRRPGTWGDAGCFSFQASKNLNSGEGGAILFNDPDLRERAYAFHNNGSGGRGAMPACTPSTPPRRSRPGRAACWCRAATTCASSRAPTAITASPTTASPG